MGFLVIPQLSQEAGAGSVAQPGGRLWASQGLGDQEPRAAKDKETRRTGGFSLGDLGPPSRKSIGPLVVN